MKDIYKESFDIAADILSENTDGYVTIAFKGNDGTVSISYEDEHGMLVEVLASAMERNEDIRTMLITALVLYAKQNGDATEIKLPDKPTLN